MSVAINTLSAILVPLGLFAMAVLLVWMRHRSSEVEARTRAETQKHFLDKFGTGRELAEFIESENGKRFLEELATRRADPLDRLFEQQTRHFRFIVPGTLLTVLGLGLLSITLFLPSMGTNMTVPGIIVLSLGLGFLISAGVLSQMTKKLNLTGTQTEQDEGSRRDPAITDENG